MLIEVGEKIGAVGNTRGAMSSYRAAPGNFDAAARAAVHSARRNNARMVIVPGNSYGQRVYHIARETDSIARYTAMRASVAVAVADVDGMIYKGVAS